MSLQIYIYKTYIRFQDLRIMWYISCPTLNHPTGSIEIHPEEKSKERPLEVITDVWIVDNLQKLRNLEDGLTDTFYESVLTLITIKQSKK